MLAGAWGLPIRIMVAIAVFATAYILVGSILFWLFPSDLEEANIGLYPGAATIAAAVAATWLTLRCLSRWSRSTG